MRVVLNNSWDWEWLDQKGNVICTYSGEKVDATAKALHVAREEAARFLFFAWFGEAYDRKYPSMMEMTAKVV